MKHSIQREVEVLMRLKETKDDGTFRLVGLCVVKHRLY
jgi:hypothetical protein